jgi:SAM-dependent methyltransferase
MPARYAGSQRDEFDGRARRSLLPGAAVLDVGAGAHPTFPTGERPSGGTYVGLDITATELDAAPPGSYDEKVVADVGTRVAGLVNRFDLALSWQVLEHVKPLEAAIENMRAYLKPGGRLVAQMSGTFSVFGILNRVLPGQTSSWLVNRLTGRPSADIFPAHYHHCYAAALRRMSTQWTRFEVVPRFLGGDYFAFSPTVRAAYLGFEEWAARGHHDNLAGYYLIDATR